MCSFIAHLLVLISLALWTARIGFRGESLTIQSGQADSNELASLDIHAASKSDEAPQPSESFSSLPDIGLAPGMITSELQAEVTDLKNSMSPLERTADLQLPPGGGTLGFVETSLEGRSKENRKRLAMENGGSPESEQAVELALAYLAQHQLNNGSWSLSFKDSCIDNCSHGHKSQSHSTAATGLALLCFLGAGKTSDDETYGIRVRKAIYYLEDKLKRSSGSAYWVDSTSLHQMYEHGIATLALCEAYQMQPSPELKNSCQLAVNFIVEAQFRDGGWGYHERIPGDLSIAAWQVMALKSAIACKLMVPQRTVTAVDHFLEKSRGGEFKYRYRTNKPSDSMTAIGNLIQQFRGRSREATSIAMAVEYLSKKGPSENDLYFNYYATQLIFHHGGPPWNAWNKQMRDYLVKTQVSEGHSMGSWWFDGNQYNDEGGRIYATCMACMILEVYYRYLPIYSQLGDDFQF
jgi:hypothetical protein